MQLRVSTLTAFVRIGLVGVLVGEPLGCSAPAPDPVASKSQTATSATVLSTVPITASNSTTTDPPPAGTEPSTTAPRLAQTCAPPPDPTTGDGIGDALFPSLGNPGLDVLHYDLSLTHLAASNTISATVTLDIEATAALDRFTLDSLGPVVSSVRVNDVEAAFERADPELRIIPKAPLSCADTFHVAIDYVVTLSEAGSSDPTLIAGWYSSSDGSFVINEPAGARTWMPSNDHPSDKASFDFDLHVSPGVTAVANGKLLSHKSSAGQEQWIWQQTDEMPTYLMLLLTGDYEIIETTVPGQVPLVHAVLRSATEQAQSYFEITPDQIAFFEAIFGPYPFDSYGLAITDSFAGLAMETQGRSLFSVEDFPGEMGELQQILLSHELAHQWFGDSVSPARWQDIWLNESLTTYAQWLWTERIGTESVESQAQRNLESRQNGTVATGLPTADGLFDYEVYDGGAVVVHALRLSIGDEHFFTLLRRWAGENAGQSRTSQDFIDLAEEVSGQSLQQFFDDWLYATDLPDDLPE